MTSSSASTLPRQQQYDDVDQQYGEAQRNPLFDDEKKGRFPLGGDGGRVRDDSPGGSGGTMTPRAGSTTPRSGRVPLPPRLVVPNLQDDADYVSGSPGSFTLPLPPMPYPFVAARGGSKPAGGGSGGSLAASPHTSEVVRGLMRRATTDAPGVMLPMSRPGSAPSFQPASASSFDSPPPLQSSVSYDPSMTGPYPRTAATTTTRGAGSATPPSPTGGWSPFLQPIPPRLPASGSNASSSSSLGAASSAPQRTRSAHNRPGSATSLGGGFAHSPIGGAGSSSSSRLSSMNRAGGSLTDNLQQLQQQNSALFFSPSACNNDDDVDEVAAIVRGGGGGRVGNQFPEGDDLAARFARYSHGAAAAASPTGTTPAGTRVGSDLALAATSPRSMGSGSSSGGGAGGVRFFSPIPDDGGGFVRRQRSIGGRSGGGGGGGEAGSS